MIPLIAPIQGDASLQEYCKMFQMYALADSSIDEKLIKTRFTCGLATLDNQKEVIRFGVNKPLTETVAHLKRRESASKTARHVFGNAVQGNDSVLTFYAKVKKYNALLNLGEGRLEHDFIRGLNSENELEAQLCYSIEPDLSLEELVDRLSRLEALSKLNNE
jgi:hypothetical protein